MDISYVWLQKYITEDLPTPEEGATILTDGAYEVEGTKAVGDDTVLDIDVLPNRASDSLSHVGVARELAALAGLTFSFLQPQPETDAKLSSTEAVRLLVDSQHCRRALKRLVVDVEVGESPVWLKERLTVLGQKSINNVVDITNYVMLELGQPVHAFDYDKLAGAKPKDITIRAARLGEEITTLDGETYQLPAGTMVIADDEKALDIAGVKGGVVSGIDETTTRVLLSACSFDPTHIRRTTQTLQLRTDASKRFENNVPESLAPLAMERLSELMSELADARVADDVLDLYPRPAAPYKVGLTTAAVNRLLGTEIEPAEVVDILERLGCELETAAVREVVADLALSCEKAPYEYGASVTKDAPRAFDCSSFASWLYVQAGIPLPRITADQFAYSEEISEAELQPGDLVFSNTKKDEGGEIYYETKEYMPGQEIPGGVDHCGLYLGDGQVIHVSRHNHDEVGGVETETLAEAPQFQNITKYGRVPEAEQERLVVTIPAWRPDLKRTCDLIEEVGRVHGYENIAAVLPAIAGKEKPTNSLTIIRDQLVALGLSEVKTHSLTEQGVIELTNPVATDKAFLRTNLRDSLDAVLLENRTHLPTLAGDELRIFEIGTVFSGKEEKLELAVGVGDGEASPELEEIFTVLSKQLDLKLVPEIEGNVATLDLPELSKLTFDSSRGTLSDFSAVDFKTPSAYPYVLRDIAVWTPAGTAPEAVERIITKSSDDLLVAVNLFDTYEKDDQISYAFKLVFQSDERTLSDKEVNEHMQAVEEALEENGGFSVR
jgi:phenylalanyl-tRNA synthetase beta subunit